MHNNLYHAFPFFRSIKSVFVEAGNQLPLSVRIALIFLIVIAIAVWTAYDIRQKKSRKS